MTLAACLVQKRGDEVIPLVVPADHIISDEAEFRRRVEEARAHAEEGKLVTFGVIPIALETGYGYSQPGPDNKVVAFVEKPDSETAQKYVSGGYSAASS